MPERRRYKRWQIEKSAQCRFNETTLSCVLRDISYKGARVFLEPAQIDLLRLGAPGRGLGENVNLTIAIANKLEAINIKSDIIWQRRIDKKTELGLYFTRIREKDKERIFRYVFDYFPQQIIRQWWAGIDGKG